MKITTKYELNKDDYEAIHRVISIFEAIRGCNMNIDFSCFPQDIIDSLSELIEQNNQDFEGII